MSRTFVNPFNNNGTPNNAAPPGNSAPPPAYSRPTPPSHTSGGPVAYGSLSDLSRGRGQAAPSSNFAYTPDASRQGYRNDYDSGAGNVNRPGQGGYGGGAQTGQSGQVDANGRRMPPPPGNYGVGIPPQPPRRNVAPVDRTSTTTAPPPNRFQSAQKTASGYIPNSVSATAASMGDRVKDGFDSIATQQRREQVVAGAGKAAAGAAKLAGKAAWQLGKFASGSNR